MSAFPTALMNTHEAFYVHVHGEQLGPYTIRHLDHLIHSGLLSTETLYWTEGLEQWQPVTDLIPVRSTPRRWLRLLIALGVLLPLVGLGLFLGPPIVDGWREQTQHEFTPEAAYWAARREVRSYLAQKSATPVFQPFEKAKVQFPETNRAIVQLSGLLVAGERAGQDTSWTVRLRFDQNARDWVPQSDAESSPKQ
jgi:hypothetical protein